MMLFIARGTKHTTPITKYAVTLNHSFWPDHSQDLIHYLGPRINYMNLHLLDDGVSPDDDDGFDDFHNDSQALERRFSYVTSTHKMVLHLVFLPHLAQIGRTQQKCWWIWGWIMKQWSNAGNEFLRQSISRFCLLWPSISLVLGVHLWILILTLIWRPSSNLIADASDQTSE